MGPRLSILITGIAGTLGTAFTELLKDDHNISGVDRNEDAANRFAHRFPNVPIECNDFDQVDLGPIDLVIHLAAMKHIDICERDARACVLNNVIKTWMLFENAKSIKADVLFMSTDKAVEPCSMYGYSKALMEGVCKENNWAFARSGNIVESSGSVLKVWDEAIDQGKPIKLTHRDMRRYFVSPENLAQRIWTAYQKGIKEIVPEMDEEILLIDLLKGKLANHGFNMDNYPGGVDITGLRPGEKLEEKLQWPK